MNYYKIHNQIIERAKNRSSISVYGEKHHIVPKSLGGNNDKSNIVLLTGKEHYLIHRLLTKIYPKNKSLKYAFWMMCNCKNRGYITSLSAYQEAKTNISKIMSERFVSQDTKDKISLAKKGNQIWLGKTHSKKSKQKQSVSALSRNISLEMEELRREKISISIKERVITDSHKENISKSKLGAKNPMFGKTGKNSKVSKKVVQIQNGKIVKIWNSLSEVEKSFSLKEGSLWSTLKTRLKVIKTMPNYSWEYLTKLKLIP